MTNDWVTQKKVTVKLHLKLGLRPLIISDGMPRSGSTLMYNILRTAMEFGPWQKVSGGWIDDAWSFESGDIYLVKMHGVDWMTRRRSSNIFYSFRDVRDALLSASRKFQTPMTIDVVRRWIRHYEAAKGYARLMVRYEDAINDLRGSVEAIVNLLGVPVSPDQILEKLPKSLGKPDNGELYSRSSLLHHNHATGTRAGEWRSVLPEDLQSRIAEEFGCWLRSNRYDLM